MEEGKAPESVLALIEQFRRNAAEYKGPGYNEMQLRLEFINPLFEALGWDMMNKGQAAPQYREVIHEDSIKMAGGTKAPDYCFSLAGRRMFFVETKKPAIDIIKDPKPAYQLRRYGWSAELPVSILTNFEYFIVYDSRQKPKESDKVTTGRIQTYSYHDYAEKWDEIAKIFSRTAVYQGSFDRFKEATKFKRGTQEVGTEFLKEIEGWRDALARNIALRNTHLVVDELSQVVQGTIDRIIFLRMCEDRGIERYGQLQTLISQADAYKALSKIFVKADEKYNSGLFHFKNEKGRSPPDELALKLEIDDKILENIIKSLYYPDCPYEFSVLPPEILGNVYEQFLGKSIRLTEGHHAKVEEKPEVKKVGGVFYTPQYIVEYIVKNTVGKLCEEKTPKQIERLHILDPACGSGSFLLGAYTYLLDHHLKYYSEQKNPGRFRDQIYQGSNGQWFLTIKEKKRILLNNIFGVDIDSQAVEVTKLSLLLKVLEGAGRDVFEQQQKLWPERALPDLGNNIKCGNSLIGPDFLEQGKTLDPEIIVKLNPFDWESEFKEVFLQGGFDAVIGNPPYVRQETLSNLKGYLESKYDVFHGIADLYVYFIEKGITLLNKQGVFSFIVANKWMRANYGFPLRTWLKDLVQEIIDFGDLPVFQGATTYPSIIRVAKDHSEPTVRIVKVDTLDFKNLQDYTSEKAFQVKRSSLKDDEWSLSSIEDQRLLAKINLKGTPLGELVGKKIFRGIITGLNEAFVIDESEKDRTLKENPQSKELIKPFLLGRDIKRYAPPVPTRFVIMIPKGWTREHCNGQDAWGWLSKNHPQIANHLSQYEAMAKVRNDKGEYWWELRSCDYYNEFEKAKILFPDISIRGNFTLDENKNYCVNTAYFIRSNDKYLLGLLNSKLMTFYYGHFFSSYRGGYLRFFYQYLVQLPIHVINNTDTREKTIQDSIISLVTQIMELYRILNMAKSENERNILQRQIDSADSKIDALVYQLYDLSPDDIKIIEAN